jgi:uncharacterized protein (TIGR02466 family)
MDNKRDLNFEAADVLRMFPTFVWKADLKPDVHQSLNENIVRKLDQIRRGEPKLAPGRAWQSEQPLHTLDEFHDLVSRINDAIEQVLEHLKVRYRAFEITGHWANISIPGAEHRLHCHPNNFLSGTYYVATHEGADIINFHDPRSQTGIIKPPATELTAENADQVVVTVKNGTLLVFPAWLPHSVDANESEKPRISISFNIMFSLICRETEQTAVVRGDTRGGNRQPTQ